MNVKDTASDGLKKKTAEYIERVAKAIKSLTFRLQGHIKERKLSGQVLNVRTGRLRRSINVKLSDDGLVGTVGTNVEYAAAHEFGLTMDQKVREHMRTIKEAWGRPLAEAKEVYVRAHTRKVNYPARSFMRSSIEDLKPDMIKEIKVEIARGASDVVRS